MNTATHTPTLFKLPLIVNGSERTTAVWVEESTGKRVCTIAPVQGERDADAAAFIARACNAHDELVAALQKCESMLSDGLPIGRAQKAALVEAARAALARAGA